MGQKLLAQSNTLGIRAISLAICRGKSFQITKIQVQYFQTSFFKSNHSIRYKINLFSQKHKRKSLKTCIKEKYCLFLQAY